MNMTKFRYAYPDCEHEGDVEAGCDLVAEAIGKIGCAGRIVNTKWSGEDGDNAYIYFEIPEDKIEDFKTAINELI